MKHSQALWDRVKRDYIKSKHRSIPALAKAYKMKPGTVQQRVYQFKWHEEKTKYESAIAPISPLKEEEIQKSTGDKGADCVKMSWVIISKWLKSTNPELQHKAMTLALTYKEIKQSTVPQNVEIEAPAFFRELEVGL